MVSDEMVEAAHAAHAQILWNGGTSYYRMRAAIEAVAPAIRAAAMEEAAVLVETHTYTVSNREPFFSLQPSQRAKDDMHHRTIAAAIRAAREVK